MSLEVLDKDLRQELEVTIKNNYSSVREFCRNEGFSNTTVSEYLRGVRTIKNDTFLRIIHALNLTIQLVPNKKK